jgi:hypothetical protein
MTDAMQEIEQRIVRAFDMAIIFLERSEAGGKKTSRQEREDLLSALCIITGNHPYAEFRSELYGVVGLAMSGTRYAYNRRALFIREWKCFFRGKCPERAEDLLAVCRKIRQDVGDYGIASREESAVEAGCGSLSAEWMGLVL